jgi:hypothetical protein
MKSVPGLACLKLKALLLRINVCGPAAGSLGKHTNEGINTIIH